MDYREAIAHGIYTEDIGIRSSGKSRKQTSEYQQIISALREKSLLGLID